MKSYFASLVIVFMLSMLSYSRPSFATNCKVNNCENFPIVTEIAGIYFPLSLMQKRQNLKPTNDNYYNEIYRIKCATWSIAANQEGTREADFIVHLSHSSPPAAGSDPPPPSTSHLRTSDSKIHRDWCTFSSRFKPQCRPATRSPRFE